MSTIDKIKVWDSKEVFGLIVDYQKQDLDEASRKLLKELTDDYSLWFNDIVNNWQQPSKTNNSKWEDGEPQWIIASDRNGIVLGYASVFLPHWGIIGKEKGRLLDVYINEAENQLDIIPELRSAVDNLFWFHAAKPRPKKV